MSFNRDVNLLFFKANNSTDGGLIQDVASRPDVFLTSQELQRGKSSQGKDKDTCSCDSKHYLYAYVRSSIFRFVCIVIIHGLCKHVCNTHTSTDVSLSPPCVVPRHFTLYKTVKCFYMYRYLGGGKLSLSLSALLQTVDDPQREKNRKPQFAWRCPPASPCGRYLPGPELPPLPPHAAFSRRRAPAPWLHSSAATLSWQIACSLRRKNAGEGRGSVGMLWLAGAYWLADVGELLKVLVATWPSLLLLPLSCGRAVVDVLDIGLM